MHSLSPVAALLSPLCCPHLYGSPDCPCCVADSQASAIRRAEAPPPHMHTGTVALLHCFLRTHQLETSYRCFSVIGRSTIEQA
eukprot:347701-Chlamydomonas_euryale.AAC.26